MYIGWVVLLGAVVGRTDARKVDINEQRPIMLNYINQQRQAAGVPPICQDSLLTSMAQQHAYDMSLTETLAQDLTGKACQDFMSAKKLCLRSDWLKAFGSTAHNIFALPASGDALSVMAQIESTRKKYTSATTKRFLYIGIGMATGKSGRQFWVQLFSEGNFNGVSCTDQPTVRYRTSADSIVTTVQPSDGLNLSIYPMERPHVVVDKHIVSGLMCTLLPNIVSTNSLGSVLTDLASFAYPTMTLPLHRAENRTASLISEAIGAYESVLSAASATIIGPSAIPHVRMLVMPTESVASATDDDTVESE